MGIPVSKAAQSDSVASLRGGWPLTAVGWGMTAALLAAAVIIAPLPLGSTGPVARLSVEAVMAIVVIAWLVTRPPERSSLWPAAAILAIGLMQLTSLPASRAAVARFAAGGDRLVDAGPATASVEPALTLLTAYRGILAAACITATTALTRRPSRWRWLAGAVASSKAIVWLLGVSIPVRRGTERVILGFIDIAGPVDWWLTPLKKPRETAAFGYHAWTAKVGQRFSLIDWAIGDVACLGIPDPVGMKVYCREGKETFDDYETTEEAPSRGGGCQTARR